MEGDGTDSIATLAQPGSPCVAVETHNEYAVTIRPDGGLIWKHWNDDLLYRYVPDAFDWDLVSEYASQPDSPQDNDELIATAPCDGSAGDGVVQYKIDPTDGTIVYRCAYDGEWYARNGEVALPTGTALLALGYNGLKLARSTAASSVPVVIDGQGNELPVQGVKLDTVQSFRARQEGFWAPVPSETATTGFDLWLIGTDGVASMVGSYAAVPPDAQGLSHLVLDGDGNAYGIGSKTGESLVDLVVKLALEPGTSAIVYTEEGLPDNDWSTNPPDVYVRIHMSGMMTGP